jgi:hypothetical protein
MHVTYQKKKKKCIMHVDVIVRYVVSLHINNIQIRKKGEMFEKAVSENWMFFKGQSNHHILH